MLMTPPSSVLFLLSSATVDGRHTGSNSGDATTTSQQSTATVSSASSKTLTSSSLPMTPTTDGEVGQSMPTVLTATSVGGSSTPLDPSTTMSNSDGQPLIDFGSPSPNKREADSIQRALDMLRDKRSADFGWENDTHMVILAKEVSHGIRLHVCHSVVDLSSQCYESHSFP